MKIIKLNPLTPDADGTLTLDDKKLDESKYATFDRYPRRKAFISNGWIKLEWIQHPQRL